MITIQSGVTEMLRSERTEEAATLLVRGKPGQTLATALRAAAVDIEELVPGHSPAEVDDPILVPGGFLLLVQFGAATPPSARATVPSLLARRMEQAGITNAEICEAPPAGARCKVLESFTPIARAWLQGSEDRWIQGTRPFLEPRLIDAGAEWLRHARMRQQREFIREHAQLPELVWAGVTAEPASFYFTMPDLTRQDYPAIGPVWYQLLSRDQLQQLGQSPVGAVDLPGGRVELTIGEPEEWVPGTAAAAKPKPRHGVFSKFRRNTSATRPEGGQARRRG